MLTVDSVETYYGEFQALDGVSLKVEQGQTVIVVGPNGAGKSTLLKTILGLETPRKGTVSFQDRQISGLSAHKVVEMGISLVPEGGRVFPDLSVRDNLRVGSYNKGGKAQGPAADGTDIRPVPHPVRPQAPGRRFA